MGSIKRIESEASERSGKGARYRADWRDPQGKKRSKTFGTKKEAVHHLATVEGDKVRGSYVDPRSARIRFADYAKTYQQGQGWKPTTSVLVASNLANHVLPAFGNRPIGAITRSEIQKWVASLGDAEQAARTPPRCPHGAMVVASRIRRGYQSRVFACPKDGVSGKGPCGPQPVRVLAPATIHAVYTTVSCIFRSAVRDHIIHESPCERISLPAFEQNELRALTPEQVATLVEHVDDRFRALVLTGVGTGLRPGELFGLRKSRVDFLRRRISVVEQVQTLPGKRPAFTSLKTKASYRVVPMPRFVVDALARHLERYPSDDVIFTMPDGQLISRTRFHERIWTPARKAAGLPASITPHSLRHTYVAGLIHQGVHPKAIQSLVGHASIQTTIDTYGHLFPNANEHASAALQDLFGEAADKLPTNKGLKIVTATPNGL